VAAAGGGDDDRLGHDRSGRARGKAARALRRDAGRADLAAGGALTPQRRTALASVVAASILVALKLTVGLAAHSLGLVSEAIHSGTDLVAALLTFFAVGVAGRPADQAHQYGHGKAEHLAALAEAAFLAAASIFIGLRALERLAGGGKHTVDVTWWVLAVTLVVIAIDASRTFVSWRASRRYRSVALASNALHFGGDLAGSVAVLAGLLIARAGYPNGDSVAALFVAALVLLAAARLIRTNIDVLMDRVPADAEEAARVAIAEMRPAVELRRLRMRQAGSRQFADVVIGVSSTDAVGQGHAAADAVERAVERALPGSDVVVHVEPLDDPGVRERAHAAALTVPGVREIHNLALVHLDGRLELSLHLKLPGGVTLEAAHDVAEQLERAILDAVPELDAVQTHLEPLTEPADASEESVDPGAVERIVREATGRPPRELRFLRTADGLVAFLTLGLDGRSSLDDAHARASEIEELIRKEQPEIADVIVHTEP
jgi:cation diffusion facilitator family transporter